MRHHIDKTVSFLAVFTVLGVLFMIAVDTSITGNFIKAPKECNEDSYQCNGNMLQYCEDNKWINREECKCRNNACVVEETCTENTFRCHDKYVQQCINNKWKNSEKCWSKCEEGVCKL